MTVQEGSGAGQRPGHRRRRPRFRPLPPARRSHPAARCRGLRRPMSQGARSTSPWPSPISASSSSSSAACGRSRMLPHAVEQFFEHGGQRAHHRARGQRRHWRPSIDLPAGDERLVLVALCPGSHEFIRVAVDYDGISQQDQDLFNLVVQRVRNRGSELVQSQEIFRRVSILQGSARDVARMLSASRLVRVSGPLACTATGHHARQRSARARSAMSTATTTAMMAQVLSDYDLIGSESGRVGHVRAAGWRRRSTTCICRRRAATRTSA